MLNDVRRDKIDGVVESLLNFFVFSQTFDPSNKTFSWKNPALELVDGDISTLRWYVSRNVRKFVLTHERRISWKMRRTI